MEHADKGAARILIVDDLEANRCILEEIIQDMGCRPVAAASGEEADRGGTPPADSVRHLHAGNGRL